MLDGWMVGESGIKANSAQFSWSLAELGNNYGIFWRLAGGHLDYTHLVFKL